MLRALESGRGWKIRVMEEWSYLGVIDERGFVMGGDWPFFHSASSGQVVKRAIY